MASAGARALYQHQHQHGRQRRIGHAGTLDPDATGEALRSSLIRHVGELRRIKPDKLVRRRAEKFANMGAFTEV